MRTLYGSVFAPGLNDGPHPEGNAATCIVAERARNVDWLTFIFRARFSMEAADAWVQYVADRDSADSRIDRIGQ